MFHDILERKKCLSRPPLVICASQVGGSHITSEMFFLSRGMHITRDMCCEHISLVVLCVYWVKEQILLRICVSQLLGTHITSDMCSQGSGTNIYSDMCFLGRGTHITRDMCSLGRRTHITSDMCFKGRGTYITKDMCSPGRGTDITSDTCFQGREHMSLVIWVSRVGERISLGIRDPG